MKRSFKGQLKRITYYNEENNYLVADFDYENEGVLKTIKIVGYMPFVNVGETLILEGAFDFHAKYGRFFKVDFFNVKIPGDQDGILQYLQSGAIKGVSSKLAVKMVEGFKEETLSVIENTPYRLLEINGIGKKLAAKIADSWQKYHQIRQIMIFLQDHGIKGIYANLIIREYSSETISIIKENPYIILKNIEEISFDLADLLASKLKVSKTDDRRIEAYILFCLKKEDEGHVFLYKKNLINLVVAKTKADLPLIEHCICNLTDKTEIVICDEKIYFAPLYFAEQKIAAKLKAKSELILEEISFSKKDLVEIGVKSLSIKLDNKQVLILEDILKHKVATITGGPGTGKTTLVRAIVSIFKELKKEIKLCAPTGRAARRLGEITNQPSSTIHKLLKYNWRHKTFEQNENNQLKCDLLIIDEFSMVDTLLFEKLISALPFNAYLILVGDSFQLPSIGAGNVLADIIKSEKIKTFTLKKIYRQAAKSSIIINAHRVREGEFPDVEREDKKLSDFYFIERSSASNILETITSLCSGKIQNAFSDIKEIQVLSPMHKGLVGTINLNKVLQKILNKKQNYIQFADFLFKENDKVMHLKNNYEKDVFNGDIGFVKSVDARNKTMIVEYYGRDVLYKKDELRELALAYAISIHKSQGSEYEAVLIPLIEEHYLLLRRNLLYTALTRGRKLVILIGTKRAVQIALNNAKQKERLSSLTDRLIEIF